MQYGTTFGYVAIGIPLVLSFAVSFFTRRGLVWNKTLNKPPGEPPGWIFPIVWTILYVLMGVASYLLITVYDSQPSGSVLRYNATIALSLYWTQLALNLIWPVLFFGLHWVGIALIDILLMTPMVLILTVFAGKSDIRTVGMFLPYCIWLCYATYLNAGIWYLNRGDTMAASERGI